jgi:hypothetical protein
MRPIDRAGREPIDLVAVAERCLDSQLHAFLSDGQVHGLGHTVTRVCGRRSVLVLAAAILAAPLHRYSCRN